MVRRGRLAVEEYFAGSSRDDVHTQQSVTKSVTSLLVGIAIDQGLIRSAREPVLSFFPEHADLRGGDPRRDAMTLDDLLTMRTGLQWAEEPYAGSDLQRLNQSRGDWVPLRPRPAHARGAGHALAVQQRRRDRAGRRAARRPPAAT